MLDGMVAKKSPGAWKETWSILQHPDSKHPER